MSKQRIIIYIIAIAVTLSLVVLVAVRLVSRPDAREHREQVEQSASSIEQARASCQNEQNPDGCFTATVNREARRLADAGLCKALEGKARVSCVSLVALDQEDSDACGELTGEDQRACADGANFKLATGSMDLVRCDRLNDEELKNTCRANIERQAVALGRCAEFDVSARLCEDTEAYRRAVEDGNLAACDQFDEDAREACAYDVEDQLRTDEDGDGLTLSEERTLGTDAKAIDTDQDGLSDSEEANTYRTNPLVRDTDGDGFGDGEEVENGYNPNGEGRL